MFVIFPRTAAERRDIALSAVQKTSPVLNTPTKDRARPPGMVNMKTSFRSEQNDASSEYEQVPEPDYSPPTSPVYKRMSQTDVINDQKKPQKTTINITDNQKIISDEDTSESNVYTRVIKYNGELPQRTEVQDKRTSGEYTTNIKVVPGAVNVMPKMNEIPKLRKVEPVTKKDDNKISPQNSPLEPDNEQKLTVKQIQENIENIYVNEIKENEEVSPRNKTKAPPAPPPSLPKVAPPPPAPVPPPPSPVPLSPIPPPIPQDFRGGGGGGGRLKQVHWTRVPKPLVNHLK